MPSPFFDLVKGTTAGTPGTGAFTPNAASTGFRAWSTVPAGWMGKVLFEDGSARELAWSYWNGTTLARVGSMGGGNGGFFWSTTGSRLSLTSAATAALIIDPAEVQSHLVFPVRGWWPILGSNTWTSLGTGNWTSTGTAGTATLGTANALEENPRIQYTSATTANARSTVLLSSATVAPNSTAGRGGYEFTCRFGASQLPTGPRLFIGLGNSSSQLNGTGEPSAATITNFVGFAKDSTDTNIQVMTGNGATVTKVDTGITLTANAFYEATIWTDPGSLTTYFLLFRLDTGAIFYFSTSTTVPSTATLIFPILTGGLSATTGTAIIMHFGAVILRAGN